jgi:hypothetical protein
MRRLTPILALAGALALAAPATAKEVLSAQACGPDRCVTTKDEPVLTVLMNGGRPSDPPSGDARSVTLRASVGEGRSGEELGTFTMSWVPRWRMLVDEAGAWMRVSPQAAAALERVTRGLGTFPPSKLGRLAPAQIDPPTTPPSPRPRQAPASTADSGTSGVWWLLVPAGIAAALGGVALVRRRRPSPGAPRPATP